MAAIARTDLARDPGQLQCTLAVPDAGAATLRLLTAGDAELLADYFMGLSEQTRRLYSPHSFDRSTATRLCAELDRARDLRFVAVATNSGQPAIIAYIIVVLRPRAGELHRYAQYGITLDAQHTCLLAPSVADAYQSRGVGTALMAPILQWIRQLGFRYMVLSGGTRAENYRAIRFYTRLGFRRVGRFRTEPGIDNHDMILEL